MSAEMPVHVLAAAISLRDAYAAGIEPSVDDVMTFHAWANQHLDVTKDVEAVMTKYMIREPEWYAATFSRRSTNRARARHSHRSDH